MDIVDYRIIRAVMRYHAQRPEIDVGSGLTADQRAGITDQLAGITDPQTRVNTVLSRYLAGAVSLGRAAELLDLPWLDLRTRFLRLDVPLRVAPVDLDEARQDVHVLEGWTQG